MMEEEYENIMTKEEAYDYLYNHSHELFFLQSEWLMGFDEKTVEEIIVKAINETIRFNAVDDIIDLDENSIGDLLRDLDSNVQCISRDYWEEKENE